MIKRLTITLAAMIMCLYASAQGFGGPQYPSPIVHPDNTVTFNLNAPQAKNVRISAQFAPKADMQRLDNGVWTITLGPVTPDIYPYCFEVDGIAVMDPQNPEWFPNEKFKALGWDCDKADWLKFREVVRAELKKRGKEA